MSRELFQVLKYYSLYSVKLTNKDIEIIEESGIYEDIKDFKNTLILQYFDTLLDGIDKVLSKELDIPVYVAENPLTCVAEGTGIMLDNLDLIE